MVATSSVNIIVSGEHRISDNFGYGCSSLTSLKHTVGRYHSEYLGTNQNVFDFLHLIYLVYKNTCMTFALEKVLSNKDKC